MSSASDVIQANDKTSEDVSSLVNNEMQITSMSMIYRSLTMHQSINLSILIDRTVVAVVCLCHPPGGHLELVIE